MQKRNSLLLIAMYLTQAEIHGGERKKNYIYFFLQVKQFYIRDYIQITIYGTICRSRAWAAGAACWKASMGWRGVLGWRGEGRAVMKEAAGWNRCGGRVVGGLGEGMASECLGEVGRGGVGRAVV